MKKFRNKILLVAVIFFSSCLIVSAQKSTSIKVQYVCSPCGMSCDKEVFDAPGECPNCKMKLVDKKTVTHKSVSPTALSKFIKSTKNLYVLDVRTKEEFEGHGEPDFGTLNNSVNIPISELENCEFV
ncbi:MAG: heavy metal-binding domain-containing protein [Sediminibacterium sp.]|nr:heavy metal-binding domain-containing protein [Sediminibacterium sp.]